MVFERKYEELYGDGKKWFRGPIIGEGVTGPVHLATVKKPKFRPGHLPATMAVKSAEISNSGLLQKEAILLGEIQGCPYICRCFGEEITTGEDNKTIYNLLLEYGSHGTLADVIKKSDGRGMPEPDVRRYARGILEGLDLVHGLGYVHCDLKPENIIIVPTSTETGNEDVGKISNFELAKRARQESNYVRGTVGYFPPETVVEKLQEAPSDIWALGCIVVEMLTGKPFWDGKKDSEIEEILFEIGEGKRGMEKYVEVSYEGNHFLKCCFERKAADRLTARMLLNHPFVADDRRGDEVWCHCISHDWSLPDDLGSPVSGEETLREIY